MELDDVQVVHFDEVVEHEISNWVSEVVLAYFLDVLVVVQLFLSYSTFSGVEELAISSDSVVLVVVQLSFPPLLEHSFSSSSSFCSSFSLSSSSFLPSDYEAFQ